VGTSANDASPAGVVAITGSGGSRRPRRVVGIRPMARAVVGTEDVEARAQSELGSGPRL
jgi:hypothetical protein